MSSPNKSHRGKPNWTPHLMKGASSKHAAIFEALASDIAEGVLVPGERLPPQREVAAMLGVDLTTVTRAFNRAREIGIIQAASGRGSFVSGGNAAAASRRDVAAVLDLSKNSPPLRETQDIRATFARDLGEAALQVDPLDFNYQETGGSQANRSAGTRWLSGRIPSAEWQRIVLCSGAQSAIFAICHILTRQSKKVGVGRYAYPGIHTVARQIGLQLVPLDMDDEGLVPEAFEQAAQKKELAALYVTPTIDNPTTATMLQTRRKRISEIALRHQVPIIEDEPYAPLLPKPHVSLASLAPTVTWHVATLSKCVTAAMRLGYIACPSRAAADELAAMLQAMTMMASPLFAALATKWIDNGFVLKTALSIREANHARQKIAAAVFAGYGLQADPNASHIWLKLPKPWRGNDFAYQAQRAGIMILPSGSFANDQQTEEAVRISIGAAPDQQTLQWALIELRQILEENRPFHPQALV